MAYEHRALSTHMHVLLEGHKPHERVYVAVQARPSPGLLEALKCMPRGSKQTRGFTERHNHEGAMRLVDYLTENGMRCDERSKDLVEDLAAGVLCVMATVEQIRELAEQPFVFKITQRDVGAHRQR